MDFDVNAHRDAQGRWHHQILGPLSEKVVEPSVYEECHEPGAAIRCIGFSDFASAINYGWRRVRMILKQAGSAPQKAAPPAGEIRSKS